MITKPYSNTTQVIMKILDRLNCAESVVVLAVSLDFLDKTLYTTFRLHVFSARIAKVKKYKILII